MQSAVPYRPPLLPGAKSVVFMLGSVALLPPTTPAASAKPNLPGRPLNEGTHSATRKAEFRQRESTLTFHASDIMMMIT